MTTDAIYEERRSAKGVACKTMYHTVWQDMALYMQFSRHFPVLQKWAWLLKRLEVFVSDSSASAVIFCLSNLVLLTNSAMVGILCKEIPSIGRRVRLT